MLSNDLSAKNIGRIAGLFGAVVGLILSGTPSSFAGVVNKSNVKNTVAVIAAAASGASVGGAVAGSIGGPVGSTAGAAAAAAGAVAAGVTYTVVTKAIEHPAATAQTVQALNPATGPLYVATHPSAVVSGVKQTFNYLFK